MVLDILHVFHYLESVTQFLTVREGKMNSTVLAAETLSLFVELDSALTPGDSVMARLTVLTGDTHRSFWSQCFNDSD